MYNLLNQIIDESSQKYSNKIAVEDYKGTITYKELYKRSEYLKEILLSLNLESENIIGVYLEKSIESIISFFGVLKSGYAYIPLDTYYSPINRIKKIIKMSNMKIIITNNLNIKKALNCINDKSIGKIVVINIDEVDFSKEVSYRSNVNNSILIDKNDLAYILYTSGSTGNPKGVMISHLNALTFINWSINYFKPGQDDIFSGIASFTFDLSVFDIYVSLSCGGKLCILPNEMANNPRSLLNWLQEKNITYIYSVPSLWVNLLNYTNIDGTGLTSLRKVLFAGEVFHPKYLSILLKVLPEKDFYNLYGPTETNVCTCYKLRKDEMLENEPVPIGSPCDGTKIMVLNNKNELINEGEEGELMVSGPIVSKGYYKDLENTVKSYVKNPLINGEEIFYKTGDIVKKCGQDIYKFVRRKDLMVKNMGYRIELGEIENTILLNKKVEDAVVVPILLENEKFLISLVVKIVEGEEAKIIELKEYIGQHLPKYMIPEVVVKVDQLPKNQNGKKDKIKIKELVKEVSKIY